ncbi:hypothetical protein CMUS01_06226 [Colletotrichum musicola]|uniref:MARVEL domain-containing protein n=1 Tax=Colletotrichum musicola TaxID=2175873 RepID=A0A8H6KN98_9PEZI|nr:hypothetical protein CMUS01_06226 [Colletotrichum musicola]
MDSRSIFAGDSEKQFHHSSSSSHAGQPTAVGFLRVAQYVSTILSLVFIACAIDRNILIPGVTSEEIVNCTATVIAALVLPFHCVRSYRRLTVFVLDGLVATFLFATFVFGVVQAGQNKGACSGPGKMGVWDNTRGCTRMKIATAFAATNFLSFAVSAVVAYLVVKE